MRENLNNYLNVLETVGLFEGIDTAELETMLTCLNAEIKNVSRDEIVLLAGDKPRYVGIVLSGQLHILWEDYAGNRLLVAAITSGELFAEALCCAGAEESPISVTADMNSTVMQLSFSRILHTCPNSCAFHTKVIENMLKVIANRNLNLQTRMEVVCLKTVRAKVRHYLEALAHKQGQNIVIPFNREEMAGFLCVERSALSHELSKMKKDGLIDYRKNEFTILV